MIFRKNIEKYIQYVILVVEDAKGINMKKTLNVLLLIICCTPVLTACNKTGIVTSTGTLGQRTKLYQQYLPNTPQKNAGSSVIYLGRDHEHSSFGPPPIRFVFE